MTANKYLDQLERLYTEFARSSTDSRSNFAQFVEWLRMQKIPLVEFDEFWEMRGAVRVWNCLRKAHIVTLRDLSSRSRQELLAIVNLGAKSVVEIQDFVQRMGLSLAREVKEEDRRAYEFSPLDEVIDPTINPLFH